MAATEKSDRTGWLAVSLAIVLGVYLFLPVVFVPPLILASRYFSTTTMERVAGTFFGPQRWLNENFGPYRTLLEAESNLLRKFFPL